MTRQMPPALFAGIIVIAAFLIIGLMSSGMPGGGAIAGNRIQDGPTIPDFTATTTTGETFRLSDHKGKVVLLNFWATWCGPCVVEIPDLIKLQEKYGPKGFIVVGLSADEDIKDAAAFARERQINYPIIPASPEVAKAVGGVSGLPTSVLLDKTGKVIWGMQGVDPTTRPEEVIGNEIERAL